MVHGMLEVCDLLSLRQLQVRPIGSQLCKLRDTSVPTMPSSRTSIPRIKIAPASACALLQAGASGMYWPQTAVVCETYIRYMI